MYLYIGFMAYAPSRRTAVCSTDAINGVQRGLSLPPPRKCRYKPPKNYCRHKNVEKKCSYFAQQMSGHRNSKFESSYRTRIKPTDHCGNYVSGAVRGRRSRALTECVKTICDSSGSGATTWRRRNPRIGESANRTSDD